LSLQGLGSHAGEPEKGLSPFPLLVQGAQLAESLISSKEDDNFFLSTLVHLQLGQENYGTMPGEGKVCFTLRAKHTEVLLKNKEELITKMQEQTQIKGVTFGQVVFDFFPATQNEQQLVKVLESSAHEAQLKVQTKTFPFRWSEDFGYY